ncbi:Zn-dependent hydrolase [Falsiroseomonas selenitidurans]|uniref:Zn-dependent hydrolase n=1 Tax=Falsiroseomonas selenitidurans TaxID=2716335 RepID=A0ABX1DYB7_9PROT|nr:Zn-dependent hydrolase [Falsiroseomonas selenitidurans]NKC29874.1 Zn-dependent hydrolase [Falsiroseomonas selenitidurans]
MDLPQPGQAPLPRIAPDLAALAARLFAALREADHDGVGITRETYGAAETAAMRRIEAVARDHQLQTAWDAAGNLRITLPGTDPALPAAACGSHLDSVPQGGNFDGAAGVIAGLLALLGAQRLGPGPRSLLLLVMRGEESAWYGRPYLGSSALFGAFDPAWLDLPCLQDPSRTLRQAMAGQGADVAAIATRTPLLDPASLSHFVELHIEQGPVMVARGVPVGLVSGIRGNHRHPAARCLGEAAHSGAVPRWLRRDAVLGAADLAMRLDASWRTLLERGEDLVMTFGIFTTDPREHAMTRVPGEVRFTLEYRSESEATLDDFLGLAQAEAAEIARERRVRIELGAPVRTPPAVMDSRLLALAQRLCHAGRMPHEVLASGAGHDAAIFANAGVPSAMVFVRNEHGSHNPHEAMEMADFLEGAAVLQALLLQGAGAVQR